MLDPSQWARLRDLDPAVAVRGYWLLAYLDWFGLRFRVSEGRRTSYRQRHLVAAGLSRTLASKHLVGRAFDIDKVGVHPDRVPLNDWALAGWIGERLGLTWGGRWVDLRDYRHFEL